MSSRAISGAPPPLRTSLRTAMDAAVDLPMGAQTRCNDETDVLDAFESDVAAVDDLLRALEARRAVNEQMLTMIREEIGLPVGRATYPNDATGLPKTPSIGDDAEAGAGWHLDVPRFDPDRVARVVVDVHVGRRRSTRPRAGAAAPSRRYGRRRPR